MLACRCGSARRREQKQEQGDSHVYAHMVGVIQLDGFCVVADGRLKVAALERGVALGLEVVGGFDGHPSASGVKRC